MNTAMLGLAFAQGQGPVNMSKNIGSSNPLSKGGEKTSFDNVLTGLLGSGSNKITKEVVKEPPKLSSEEKTENEGIYGTLINGIFYFQNQDFENNEELVDVIKNIPENLDEDIKNELMQYVSDLEKNEVPEDYNLIKDKIINLFKENNLLPKAVVDDLFSEMNIKNLTLKEKEAFISTLTKELIGILEESAEVKISETISKLDFLKGIIQKSENPLTNILKLSEEKVVPITSRSDEVDLSSKKGENKETKSDVDLQKGSSKTLTNASSENVQNKTDLSFQKSLDGNLNKLTDESQVQEKVEPKNLPKFIENQIKNSFKAGENGFREITVKINPEHLGKLVLRISTSEDSNMTVKIMAQSKNIKEFLDTNLSTLRNNLENSGIKTGEFNIEIDFEKNFNQSNGSNQNFSDNLKREASKNSADEQSFEERIESIFNNSGELEVFA